MIRVCPSLIRRLTLANRCVGAQVRAVAASLAGMSTSKMGSSTTTAAVITTRSAIRGIPSGRSFLPSAFGIHTRRTASARYVLLCSFSASSPSQRSSPYAAMSAKSCLSTPGAPWLALHRSRRTPARPCDTACRTEGRTDSSAHPSLSPVTPSAASERFPEVPGPQPNLLVLCHFLRCLEPGPLSSAGITRLHRSYGPLRHPEQPGLSLAGSGWLVTPQPPIGVSRVASISLRMRATANTPVEPLSAFSLSSPAMTAFPA